MSNTPRHAPPPRATSRLQRPSLLYRYAMGHLQALVSTLGQLVRQPFNSLLTALVIGIALALPAGLHLMIDNLGQVVEGWKGSTRISLFLTLETATSEAEALAKRLGARTELETVTHVAPADSLAEFEQHSGMSDLLDLLERNPLPSLLVLTPRSDLDPVAMQALLTDLQALPEVELAQLDMAWVKRLHAMLAIGQRGVVLLGALLGLAVLVVVGNTIRLGIQNRREEILVTKLIGATNAFIRRPFLYMGVWYGLLGGLMALALVALALHLLAAPVGELALLYQSDFVLHNVTPLQGLLVVVGGALLGLVGSWVAVGRHLSAIEPR